MKKEKIFLLCKHCGNLVKVVYCAGVPMICCGQAMIELTANTSDGAVEKHVPVIERNGLEVTVKVGSAAHPMTQEHFIQWIYLKTEKGVQGKQLKANDESAAQFTLQEGDAPKGAYAYCNLHGLWKAARPS